jgi:Glycosyl transferases group 1
LDKHLHIVCLDVPYPPDYGGVFDLFYKIVSLHEKGVKIHLHCFEYGRGRQNGLIKYCVDVNYYRRQTHIKDLLQGIPYIVSSRANKSLLENLLKDDYPVLLEGIHCTYFLYQNKLSNKKVFIRLHNVEYEYYRHLARAETSILKKLYFLAESRLLKKYERNIARKALCIGVTQKDIQTYHSEFGVSNIKYLPVFLPYVSVNSKTGRGEFCLYHGNLSVIENEKAVVWLLKNVFRDLGITIIIAGKDPSEKLVALVKKNKEVSIVANPSLEQMNGLISAAQVNILPSFNSTGIKIKLLNAIFNGRHCLVNNEAVAGTGLEALCHVASGAPAFKDALKDLFNKPFMQQDIQLRMRVLKDRFDNNKNAEQLMQWIY